MPSLGLGIYQYSEILNAAEDPSTLLIRSEVSYMNRSIVGVYDDKLPLMIEGLA